MSICEPPGVPPRPDSGVVAPNGTVTINFSCDSLAAARGNQGYTNRISWRRLR